MNNLRQTLPPLASLLPFEAAARLESFSKAAGELHITQAAVSRQIRDLERNLGVRLFVRRNRAVFLTEEGRALSQSVSAALRHISDQAVALREPRTHSPLVLLCQHCEAFYWLMPRLAGFQQRHPDIDLQVATSTRPIVEFGGHFDVALQTTGRASGPHPLAFTAADDVFPVCSPGYLTGNPALSLDALSAHKLLHYRSSAAEFMTWENWLQAFDRRLHDYPLRAQFDSYPLVLQAAIEGHGIALGWRRSAERLIESGALVKACAESVALENALSVYRHADAGVHDEGQVLLEWLEEQLSVQA